MRKYLVLLFLLLITSPLPAGAPTKGLKSKDVAVRLKAIATIRTSPPEDAEELLIGALMDRDWEVRERATLALGDLGGEDSVKPLLILALAGPVRRIRFAAVDSLIRIAPEEAAGKIAKFVGGKAAIAALEALHRFGPRAGKERIVEAIARGFGARELVARVAAARLVGGLSGRKRKSVLDVVFRMRETTMQAAVLDAIRESPDEDDIPPLLGLIRRRDLNDVLSRRTLAAMVAVVESAEPGKAADRLGRKALLGSELARDPMAAARFVRLAGMLAKAPEAPETEPDRGDDPPPELPRPLVSFEIVEPTIDTVLEHKSDVARAAAVFALGEIGSVETLDRAALLAEKDESGRVRLHALRAVVRVRGLDDVGTTFDLTRRRLEKDPDWTVREYAAVALGRKGLDAAVAPLSAALVDKDWGVAVCAAVSLGKTECPAGLTPLKALLDSRDWRLRGAAVVGLGHLRSTAAVPDVIAALGDRDAAIAHSAYAFLRRMTTKDIKPRPRAWTEWWNSVKDRYSFPDLEKEAREAKKYGYATTYRGVYENLDVIVLQSRGDTIEKLLDRLTIKHRLTRSGQVPSAGVHPRAIFFANCTGEITPKDAEQLSWFVRTGGYLFGSCWALSETIEQVYAGVVRKLPTMTEVLDNVEAERCPTKSPYLTGVFEGVTRPIYVLYGAHLIEVLDPERVEVLMDSPQCADRFVEGNLACWFDAGHGVILDSVNHFDLQGLERADGLKTAEDRMAYAIDHMGLSYEEVRKLAEKRIWGSRSKAAAGARDLSAFRFITNFVRHKRKVDR